MISPSTVTRWPDRFSLVMSGDNHVASPPTFRPCLRRGVLTDSLFPSHRATSVTSLAAVVRYLRFATLGACFLLVVASDDHDDLETRAGRAFPIRSSPPARPPCARGYTGCARVGRGNAGYASANNQMYWRMFSGHNCTNYAAYRMVHSGMANSRPWTGSGNATNWGVAMSRITNGTPAVGAVAWWRAYHSPAGSAGHVAYVEQVVDSDTIIVSQDSWGGDFSWKQITRYGGQWPSGFVHFHDLRTLRNTAQPQVSGTPRIGSTLTATAGHWSVSGVHDPLRVARQRRRHPGRHVEDPGAPAGPGGQAHHRSRLRDQERIPQHESRLVGDGARRSGWHQQRHAAHDRRHARGRADAERQPGQLEPRRHCAELRLEGRRRRTSR